MGSLLIAPSFSPEVESSVQEAEALLQQVSLSCWWRISGLGRDCRFVFADSRTISFEPWKGHQYLQLLVVVAGPAPVALVARMNLTEEMLECYYSWVLALFVVVGLGIGPAVIVAALSRTSSATWTGRSLSLMVGCSARTPTTKCCSRSPMVDFDVPWVPEVQQEAGQIWIVVS